LQVGTRENKNIERLVWSIKEIRCHLVLVGELSSPALAALKATGVSYTSYSRLAEHELVQVYRDCDIVTFISTYEGFGLPILEANALGKPVVTSNIPPMNEIAHGAACLVDPLDNASIKRGIEKVIQDSEYRASLVHAGLANAAQYSASVIAQKYADLYDQVAEACTSRKA